MKIVNIVIPIELPEGLDDNEELIILNSLMGKLTPKDAFGLPVNKYLETIVSTHGNGWTRNNTVKVHFMTWEYLGDKND